MAVKIVEDSAVLTLDFWDKEAIYNGQVYPVGTLACDALNIPGEVVSHMEKLCEKLNGFMKTFDSGKGDPALLPEAKFSAMKLLELMAKYKPFSYINMAAFRDLVKRCFSPNAVKSANALIQAQKKQQALRPDCGQISGRCSAVPAAPDPCPFRALPESISRNHAPLRPAAP